MSILIKNGLVITRPLDGEAVAGDLLVDGARVISVGEAPTHSGVTLDASGCWLLPGLVDAHTHIYGALATGMPLKDEPPRNFPQVLERIWWRLDKALTLEDVRSSAYAGCMDSIRSGITTLFDHHASPSNATGSLDVIAAVTGQLGLRASLAYEVSDRDGAAACAAGIAENRRFIELCRRRDDPLLRAHFGLHALFTVSDETLLRCGEIGAGLGAGFHMHLLEHRPELERFLASHPGRQVTEHLEAAGILGPDTILAHAVHVDDGDMQRLARTGAVTVHNPKSNMGNAVGVSPLSRLLGHGVRSCLGSDGFYDLPQQMTTAALLQCLAQGDPSAFGMSTVLQMVYGNNAALAERTFGLPFGRLEPGCAADVLVVPYDPMTPFHRGNLGAHISAALGVGPRDVLIAGQVRLRSGQFPGLDEPAVRATARRQASELWRRL